MTARLADYATSLRYEDLTDEAIHAGERILVDTIGCAVGAYDTEPARIARRLAARSNSVPGAQVWGSGAVGSVEAAAFANGVMIRYLDFNDTYMSKEASHPSDMIGAILAVGQSQHASGRQTLLAMATAFEIEMALADACNLFDKGFDHGLYIGLGTATGVGQLLGLTREQMGNAIALACTPNVPTRQTRSGELTMWKGCAAAASARAAIFAAELAREGMTGPAEAFEGRHGIFEQVTGPFELADLGGNGRPFAAQRSGLKYIPTEYNSQLPLYLTLKLREKVPVDEIASIHIEVYHFTFTEIGSEPEKWRPTTRETADHSLPYMVAVALMDGKISVESFSDERMRDPKLPSLMDRITISENAEFSRRYPASMDCRIEIRTRQGARIAEEGSFPKGHAKNPMTDAEVEAKFRDLCRGKVAPSQGQSILDAAWGLHALRDVDTLIDLIRVQEP